MGNWLATFIERRRRLGLPGLLGLYVLLMGVVAIAPPFLSFAVAVLTAGGWCWWLEQSTDLSPKSAP